MENENGKLKSRKEAKWRDRKKVYFQYTIKVICIKIKDRPSKMLDR